ncbi:MAG: sigma-54 dependent transcriptional regulator [Vicinamibacterales bacterium]
MSNILSNPPVLVLDDQLGVAGSLQQKAFLRNYESLPYNFIFESCVSQKGFEEALAEEAVAREGEIAIVLLDLKFGEDELFGLRVLQRLNARYPALPVLVMSSAARDVETLGHCLEGGAVGFVEKHRSPEYLLGAIERALGLVRSHLILGQTPPLRDLRRQAARLSPYDQIPVLIAGERGTGKERVARYIHDNGPRRLGPFLAVNCAAVPEGLFEAEFFGAEAGAFTGAKARRIGILERAHGGTLFLDEVGLLPIAMQAKLLRVLQERSFNRLGSSGGEVVSKFQLLSATNVDPQLLVSQGRMREDFLDRIAAVTVRTPPLRDCLDDVGLLASHFLSQLVGDRKALAPDALRLLKEHHWPGNVRELQRVVQEAVVRSEDAQTVRISHLPGYIVRAREDAAEASATEANADRPEAWSRRRLIAELLIAVEAKRRIQGYKGRHWKAEFMRRVYPLCRAQSAKGVADLLRRLTKGPWGDPTAMTDPELRTLIEELRGENGE